MLKTLKEWYHNIISDSEGRRTLLFILAFYVTLASISIYTAIRSEQTPEPEKPKQDKQTAISCATEADMERRYNITAAERWDIASAVTAEAEGEPFAGKVAVAQCILQACEDDGIRPTEALTAYEYTEKRPEPTDEALEAVAAVFDHGYKAASEPIKYFYAPAVTASSWHESQDYVLTINNHKFFKEQKYVK